MKHRITLGGALLGHREGQNNSTNNRPPLKGAAARAAARTKELAHVAAWRGRHGVLLGNVAGWLEVAATCLWHLHGHRPWAATTSYLSGQLPPHEVRNVSAEDLEGVLSKTAGRRRLHTNAEAGKLIELADMERVALEGEGIVLRTLHAHDETAAARALRRAERRKRKARERVAKYRKNKRLQGANSVTGRICNIAIFGNAAIDKEERYTQTCNIRPGSQADRVLAAVAAGAATVSEIASATGLGSTALRPILTRLKAGGVLMQEGRGRYSLNVRRGLHAR